MLAISKRKTQVTQFLARRVYGQKSCHDKRHLDIGYERPDVTFQSVILLS